MVAWRRRTGTRRRHLFFRTQPSENHDPSAPRTLEYRREVMVRSRDGERLKARHKNTLYVYKPVYGQVLSEVPFSHAKQLIAMLPTLRQYAMLATLLKRSFSTASPPRPVANKKEEQANKTPMYSMMGSDPRPGEDISAVPKRQELDAFSSGGASSLIPSLSSLNGGAAGTSTNGKEEGQAEAGVQDMVTVYVTLAVHFVPRLNVVFPMGPKSANVHVEVALNGKIRILSQNITPDGVNGVGEEEVPGKGKKYTAEDLALALELFEDLDEWC